MSSRALSLATVMLLIACFFVAVPAAAQNLEAGKSPSQIFAGTCAACHKSPRGLLKTVSPGSLAGFLREHYTTSSDMASLLAGYLASNGVADTRSGGGQPRQAREGTENRPEATPDQLDRRRSRSARPESEPQQAARPDNETPSSPETGRQGRGKRQGRQTPAPDADGRMPVAGERGTDGEPPALKPRPGKRGKQGPQENAREAPKDAPKAAGNPEASGPADTTKPAAATEAGKSDAPAARLESGKPSDQSSSSPANSAPAGAEAAKSDAKPEASKESEQPPAPPPLRADPVPAVTPAPPASSTTPAPSSTDKADSTAAPAPSPAAPVAASAPPPVAPAGPPAPPISQ